MEKTRMKNNELNAEKFYNDFKESMQEGFQYNGVSYIELYKGDTKRFTQFINGKIIADIIRNNNIDVSFEYFRVDVTGWEQRKPETEKEAEDVCMNPHLWDLKIAVEHENNQADWNDEIIKLVHINCPLRVVIGYNDSDNRETDITKLGFAAICIKKTKAFSSFDGELLVILGNCKGKYKKFDYRGYLFNRSTNSFKKIEKS